MFREVLKGIQEGAGVSQDSCPLENVKQQSLRHFRCYFR